MRICWPWFCIISVNVAKPIKVGFEMPHERLEIESIFIPVFHFVPSDEAEVIVLILVKIGKRLALQHCYSTNLTAGLVYQWKWFVGLERDLDIVRVCNHLLVLVLAREFEDTKKRLRRLVEGQPKLIDL